MSPISRRNFLETAALGLTALHEASGKVLAEVSALNTGTRSAESRGLGSSQLRGIMVDAARLPEKISYYRELIDFCREWNLNALLFSLTDDQGSMLRFKSHPELVTHRHALTPEEAKDLSKYGTRQGVTVIPVIESFGHTRYITSVPRYAHLEDRDPNGEGHFSGLIPVEPETLSLIGDLYREAAALFASPYLHGGCDEVNWGGSAISRQALKTTRRSEIWADYLNLLDGICRHAGKELIVWGDYVLHKQPGMLPRLRKSVIVMDWQYAVTDPAPLAQIAELAIRHGLRVVGAPAITWCKWGPRIGDSQLRNIDAYVDAYTGLRHQNCLGVIVTNWTPSRYIQRSLWDSLAYGAVALNRGSEAARRSAIRAFVERFYKATWSATWADIFSTFYGNAPARLSCARDWTGPQLPVPWASEADLRAAVSQGAVEAPSYNQLKSNLAAVEDGIKDHRQDFSQFALSADYLEHAFWRRNVIAEGGQSLNAGSAEALIQSIAARDADLLAKLEAAWNVGRFSDSRGANAPLTNLAAADQLLFRMRQAAAFSRELAQSGDRFSRLVSSARRG